MNSFSKKIQHFFVYFFTGVSVVVVLLGMTRIKKGDPLAASVAPGQPDSASNTSVKGATVENLKGQTYQTPWGNLAVAIQVKDGKVVAVSVPTLPDSPPSSQAKPYLIQQALTAGGANIQGVSGATITTNAFKASLESALAQSSNTSSGSGPVVIDTRASTQTPVSIGISMATPQKAPSTSQKTSVSTTRTSAGVSGNFTGNAYQTPWGNTVASIKVTNGKITDVTMPTVPDSPPSQYAQSYLVQQALAAGSANIQGVSGATYTSIAFKSSLESAISKANATAKTQGQATLTSPASSATSAPVQPAPRRYQREVYEDD